MYWPCPVCVRWYKADDTAKAAVVQFSKSAAIDLAPYNIRVNCIAPGHIATGITNYDLGSVIRTMQPLQRHGSPADVADAVVYLVSDRSAQITGIGVLRMAA